MGEDQGAPKCKKVVGILIQLDVSCIYMKGDQKCKKNDFWGIFLAWPPFCRKCPFYTVKTS